MGNIDIDEVKNRDLKNVCANYTDVQIFQKIVDAEAQIVDTFPQVTTRLANKALSQTTYNRIVADMVLRVLTDPEGLSSESDGSYSYTRSAFGGSPDLWIPDKDAELLGGGAVKLPRTAYAGPQAGYFP